MERLADDCLSAFRTLSRCVWDESDEVEAPFGQSQWHTRALMVSTNVQQSHLARSWTAPRWYGMPCGCGSPGDARRAADDINRIEA